MSHWLLWSLTLRSPLYFMVGDETRRPVDGSTIWMAFLTRAVTLGEPVWASSGEKGVSGVVSLYSWDGSWEGELESEDDEDT